jgi:hypothetical protein
MKNTVKFLGIPFLIILLVYVISLNFRLYYNNKWQGDVNTEVLAQLYFLEHRLKLGAGEEMQGIYPEGFIFITALYGLTWADFLENINSKDTILQKGISQLDWAIQQINQENVKKQFGEDLELEYGAFYNGWRAYLMGKKLSLQKKYVIDSLAIREFQMACEKIFSAYAQSQSIFLDSYIHNAWPADNVVCIAALRLHDRLYPPRYQRFIKNWIEKVKQKLDKQTGLIPHYVANKSKDVLTEARGSSQSLILAFLPEIDSQFAKNQFVKYKQHFLAHRLSLPGILEYPQGFKGKGDIDSGPVIWGVGGAASIVGIRACLKNKDINLAWQIRNCVEAFGLPLKFGGQKFYLLGSLPMADAFIAWSNIAFLKDNQGFWEYLPWGFHLISLILLGVILYLAWRIYNW